MKSAEAHLHWRALLILCIAFAPLFASAQKPQRNSHSASRVRAPQSIGSSQARLNEKSQLQLQLSKDPNNVKARQQLAMIYFKEKGYKQTIQLLEPVSDKLPRQGLYLLTLAYRESNDPSNEVRMLQFLLATQQDDIRAHTMLGEAYIKQSKFIEAIGQFRTVLEINPKYREAYLGLTTAYEKINNNYELRIVYLDMIKIFGEEKDTLASLCRLYSVDAFFPKAIEYCNKAIKVDPKNPENHVHLALALKDSGGEKKAFKILEQSAQRFPASESTQFNYANVLSEQNNHIASHRHYKLAVQANPNSAESLVKYAEASFKLHKYDEALEAFYRACKLNREFIKNFHAATTELRQNNQSRWHLKYHNRQQACQG